MTEIIARLTTALASRYTIERELGRGGMAVVYLAHDLRHDRQVAIKVLRPELAATIGAERFLREIKIAAGLTHPHILSVHDSGEADGHLFYVMPYVEGESLRDRLSRERQLPIDDAVTIAREVASALSYAHDQGVIHRDIKPENILLSAGGAVVADFGIARAVSQAGGEQLTETGMAMGTPAYMSPEQASADTVDARSDIYSLGSVLYEMLGGDPPFLGTTPQAILARKMSDTAPSLRPLRDTVSEGLEQVVLRSLARSPADRYATAEQFAQALAMPSESLTPTRTVPVDRSAKRRWMMAGGAVAVATIIAVISALAALPRGGGVSLNPNHVVVAEFRNATGDPSLDQVGERTGHWITQGIQQAAIPVTPWNQAQQLWDYVQTEVDAGRARDPIRMLAEEAGVGTVISGAIYLEGDSLVIQADLTDANRGRLIGSVDPVRGARTSAGEVIQEAQHRVMALLALRFDEDFGEWANVIGQPPNLEAYQALTQGMSFWGRAPGEAIRSLRRAAELDSTWAQPLIQLAILLMNLNRRAEADSVLLALEKLGDSLNPFERAQLQTRRARMEGNREEWYRNVRRAADLAPGSPERFNSSLVSFRIMNKPAESIELLLSMDPERGWMRGARSAYWSRLIEVYRTIGEHSRALEIAERQYLLEPNEAELWLQDLVLELAALGRVEQLKERLDEFEALPDAGAFPRILVQVVETLDANGEEEASQEILERAIAWFEGRPSNVASSSSHRYWYGKALCLAARHDNAQEIFNALVDEFPEDVDLRGTRGFVAAVRGDTSLALRDATWLERYEWGGTIGDATIYWRVVIAGALGDSERVVELLGDADNWWAYRWYDRVRLELDPIRGYPEFQELMRPKG